MRFGERRLYTSADVILGCSLNTQETIPATTGAQRSYRRNNGCALLWSNRNGCTWGCDIDRCTEVGIIVGRPQRSMAETHRTSSRSLKFSCFYFPVVITSSKDHHTSLSISAICICFLNNFLEWCWNGYGLE